MNVLYLFGFVFLRVILPIRCTDPQVAASGFGSKKKGVSRTTNPYANQYANGYYPSQQNFYTPSGYSAYPYTYNRVPYSAQQMFSPAQMATPYGYASTQPYYFPNMNYLNSPQAHLAGTAAMSTSYASIPQQMPYPWYVPFPTYPPTIINRNITRYAAIPNQQMPFSWGTSFPAYAPALMGKGYLSTPNNFSPQPTAGNSTGNDTMVAAMQPIQPSYYPNDVAAYPTEADQSLNSPIITTNGEAGADMNSLPPQVKEFIDMIPQILSMPENSQPAESPQPSIPTRPRPLPNPAHKHHKLSPSYKKKSYYPQDYYQ